MVTAGNCPWRLTDSASLSVWKWANALNGTGVGRAAAVAVPLGDAPDPDEPEFEVLVTEEEVVALLAVDNTVAVELAVAEGESGEVDAVLDTVGGLLRFAEANADVEKTGEIPAVEDGVSNAFPAVRPVPDPAPEDDPSVFDATAEDELLVSEDWM